MRLPLCVPCGFKKGNHRAHREKYTEILFEAIPPLSSVVSKKATTAGINSNTYSYCLMRLPFCVPCGFKKGNHRAHREKYT